MEGGPRGFGVFAPAVWSAPSIGGGAGFPARGSRCLFSFPRHHGRRSFVRAADGRGARRGVSGGEL